MPPTRTNRRSPAKQWTITLFDFPEDFYLWQPQHMKYAVWQIEACPDTGRRHVQGFFSLKKKKRLTGVQALFPGMGPHLEVAVGSVDANYAYCTKEESRVDGPYEEGTRPKKGTAKLFEDMWASMKAGRGMYDVVDESPGLLRYPKSLRFAQGLALKQRGNRWRKMTRVVLEGPAGCGKTRLPIDLWGYENCHILTKSDKALWWDGYEGQKVLVLDDFSMDWGMTWTTMLRILDGHPLRLNVKGDSAWATYEYVYITTNLPLDLWYPEKALSHRDPLLRRIDQRVSWRFHGGELKPMRLLTMDPTQGVMQSCVWRGVRVPEEILGFDLGSGSGMMGNTEGQAPVPTSSEPIIPLDLGHGTDPLPLQVQVQERGGGGSGGPQPLRRYRFGEGAFGTERSQPTAFRSGRRSLAASLPENMPTSSTPEEVDLLLGLSGPFSYESS